MEEESKEVQERQQAAQNDPEKETMRTGIEMCHSCSRRQTGLGNAQKIKEVLTFVIYK